MYDFKNSFFANVVVIHRAKYIFSKDMFCLYHIGAKIGGVIVILLAATWFFLLNWKSLYTKNERPFIGLTAGSKKDGGSSAHIVVDTRAGNSTMASLGKFGPKIEV